MKKGKYSLNTNQELVEGLRLKVLVMNDKTYYMNNNFTSS